MADNFPPGKLPGLAAYADTYVNTSQGEGDATGPWNDGEQWDRIDDVEGSLPADGGDGQASVQLGDQEMRDYAAMVGRLKSDPNADPETGTDLGGGPGAGRLTDTDLGGAADMAEAKAMARAKTQADGAS